MAPSASSDHIIVIDDEPTSARPPAMKPITSPSVATSINGSFRRNFSANNNPLIPRHIDDDLREIPRPYNFGPSEKRKSARATAANASIHSTADTASTRDLKRKRHDGKYQRAVSSLMPVKRPRPSRSSPVHTPKLLVRDHGSKDETGSSSVAPRPAGNTNTDIARPSMHDTHGSAAQTPHGQINGQLHAGAERFAALAQSQKRLDAVDRGTKQNTAAKDRISASGRVQVTQPPGTPASDTSRSQISSERRTMSVPRASYFPDTPSSLPSQPGRDANRFPSSQMSFGGRDISRLAPGDSARHSMSPFSLSKAVNNTGTGKSIQQPATNLAGSAGRSAATPSSSGAVSRESTARRDLSGHKTSGVQQVGTSTSVTSKNHDRIALHDLQQTKSHDDHPSLLRMVSGRNASHTIDDNRARKLATRKQYFSGQTVDRRSDTSSENARVGDQGTKPAQTGPPSEASAQQPSRTQALTNGTLSPLSTSTQVDAVAREPSMDVQVSLNPSTLPITQTRTPESSRAVTPTRFSSPSRKFTSIVMPPPAVPAPPTHKPVESKQDVEDALARCMTSFVEDQRYTVKMALAKARCVRKVLEESGLATSQPQRVFMEDTLERSLTNGMIGVKRSNPFVDLKPTHRTKDGKPDGTFNSVTLETLDPGGKRLKAPPQMIGCQPTRWKDPSKSTPAYTHCTQVRKNVAAPNQRALHSYPYFGENVDDKVYEALHSRYDIDVPQRNRKVLQGQQSRQYMSKVRQWLEQIGSSENDILYFLLNPDPEGDIYGNRDKHCKEDFNRDGNRWSKVFDTLNKSTYSVKQVQTAAWACDTFLAKARFSIWHIVRKAPITDLEVPHDDSLLDQAQALACRVCHEHDCPYHIDFQEVTTDDESYDEEDPVASAEALDVDHPPENNLKRHVTIAQPLTERPDSRDEIVVASRPRSRDKAAYKRLLEQIVETSNHDRNRFYPCFHPGKSCSNENCKCFRDGLLCEKACGCSASCDRKFQGCSCVSGSRKVCYQDDRCDCFRLHRECDADLCVGCGADVALDPENRHDENLRKECCQNINMQLGIPKRTILGRSRIHGFGLYSGEKIKKHEFVGEYSGEIVLEDERIRRGEVYEIQKMSYLFILTADQEIDSHHVGNKIRFVNHASNTGRNGACNLRAEIVICNMTPRIGMYAIRDIEVGEELFFNYGDHYMSLLKDTAAADDQGEKDKGKNKAGRKKKAVRRRKKLVDEFAEPEYDEPELVEKGEGSAASKKVTPRWRDDRGKDKRGMASKSAGYGTPMDLDEGEEIAESEADEPEAEPEETPIKTRRGGKRKKMVVDEDEVEESDFEPEGVEAPRRVSGRAAKRRRLEPQKDEDEEETAPVTDESDEEQEVRRYVAPIINGKKKRGRPKKSFYEGGDD